METKTNKTPLMTAELFEPSSCPSGLASESKLSRSPEAQFGFVPKLSLHGGKNTALRAEKPCRWSHLDSKRPGRAALFFSGAQRNGVFAADDVCSCEATSGEGRAGARACSQAQSHDITTKAQSAKDISRGVLYVFVHNRSKSSSIPFPSVAIPCVPTRTTRRTPISKPTVRSMTAINKKSDRNVWAVRKKTIILQRKWGRRIPLP